MTDQAIEELSEQLRSRYAAAADRANPDQACTSSFGNTNTMAATVTY
jgi:hypothetical protein